MELTDHLIITSLCNQVLSYSLASIYSVPEMDARGDFGN